MQQQQEDIVAPRPTPAPAAATTAAVVPAQLLQPITRLEFYAFVVVALGPEVLGRAIPVAAAVIAAVWP